MAISTPLRLFDDFLVVGLQPSGSAPTPTLLYSFSAAQGVEGADAHNAAVVEFCFPDVDDASMLKLHSESFTFTLTHDDGRRTFAFSRRLAQPPGLPICLCVMSQRPWFSLFMHMLDILQLNYSLNKFVPAFIGAAHSASLPAPGGSIVVNPGALEGPGTFRLHVPEEERPTGVAFEPLLTSLGVANLLRVLAALMREQRLIFISSRWGHAGASGQRPRPWVRTCARRRPPRAIWRLETRLRTPEPRLRSLVASGSRLSLRRRRGSSRAPPPGT